LAQKERERIRETREEDELNHDYDYDLRRHVSGLKGKRIELNKIESLQDEA